MSRLHVSLLVGLSLWLGVGNSAHGSLTLVSGPGLPQTGNLVVNGSFELGHPMGPDTPNQQYWATGSTLTPFATPPGWTSSGQTSTYAVWGSDDLGASFEIRGSDTFPDGQLGIYFGNAGATVSQPPTFNADGTVSFPSAPVFSNVLGGPVTLSQTVNTQLSPAPSYTITFWVSGEGAVLGLTDEGIFGFRMTNVLAGDPINYLTVPAGAGPQGASRVYRYDFVPLIATSPVTIEFINWGHMDLSVHGGSTATTELVIDDVVIQPIPEAGSLALAIACATGILWRLRRCGRHCREGTCQ